MTATIARPERRAWVRLGEVCAGYGGLGLALDVLGIDHELAWYADDAPEPAAVMAYHHPTVPNLGDITTITNAPPADIVTAGFPCQPVSVAGARKGPDDERWIVDDVCRVARLAGARWLILENVAGLLTANRGDALSRVCEAMAREGFTHWEWTTLHASDIGACHRRRRWFCLAVRDAPTWPGASTPDSGCQPLERDGPSGPATGPSSDSADAETLRRRTRRDGQPPRRPPIQPERHSLSTGAPSDTCGIEPERRREPSVVAGPPRSPRQPDRPGTDPSRDSAGDRRSAHADTDLERRQTRSNHTTHRRLPPRSRERFGKYADAVHQHEQTLGRPAPNPTTNGRLSPRFVEWMMMLPTGWVTNPAIELTRAAQLRVLGNGVIPLQAATAIHQLTLDRSHQ